MALPPIRSADFYHRVLLEVWYQSGADYDRDVNIRECAEYVLRQKSGIPPSWIDPAIEDLFSKKFVINSPQRTNDMDEIRITREGLHWAETTHRSHDGYQDQQLEDRGLREAAEARFTGYQSAPNTALNSASAATEPERLDYTDFRKLLLIYLVVETDGEFDRYTDVVEVAKHVEGRFKPSFTLSAVQQLKDEGFVNAVLMVAGDADIQLTGKGYEQAERWLGDFGWSDFDEVPRNTDKGDVQPILTSSGDNILTSNGDTLVAGRPDNSVFRSTFAEASFFNDSAAEAIVRLEDHRGAVTEFQHSLRELTAEVRRNNALMNGEHSEEIRRSLSELDAGDKLLDGDTAQKSLVTTLLYGPLLYLVDKTAGSGIGELAKMAVQKLLAWYTGT